MATLSVVLTLHHVPKKGYVFREPKTKHSRRLVDLSPSLAVLLREHCANQELERKLLGRVLMPGDLVFSYPDGTPLPPNSVTTAVHKLAQSLGLSNIRLHDLRHTQASLMLRQGVQPKVVSERLGHSSVAITRIHILMSGRGFRQQRHNALMRVYRELEKRYQQRRLVSNFFADG